MIQFGGTHFSALRPRAAQMIIGGKTVASFDTSAASPNNQRQTATQDIADISPIARALSQSAVRKSEKYGNFELAGRRIIPVRGVGNDPDAWDAPRRGKMASLDRFLGQTVGTSYGALKKSRQEMSEEESRKPGAFRVENLLYSAASAKAETERDAIQYDMKKLLREKGIKVKDSTAFSFTVSKNGAIEVETMSMSLDKSKIEEILNGDKGLALRMVKNSAVFKLQDPNYDDGGSASSAEMALVNAELQEKFGFGLDKLGEIGVGNVWGFNRGLDAAMADDAIFEEQVFTYLGSTAEFDVEWSFGNGHVADKTNSAHSFLPPQMSESFARDLAVDPKTAGSEIKFTLTPDGRYNVIDASSKFQEYSDEDRQYAMQAMNDALMEGAENGELEQLKEASKRAIEEHIVKNGGSKENLEVVITARNGNWSIEVEEKGITLTLPEEEEDEKEKQLPV
jgi:hypothetical protein